MNRIALYMIIFSLAMMSCEPEWEEPYQVYKINKGTHAPLVPKISSLQSETLVFNAVFNESAIYQNALEENQQDINKLMGFADCNSKHHDNSARFGWRWFEDQLEIHAYCYVNGERVVAYIGTVELNEKVDYMLNVSDTQYTFQIEDEAPIIINRGDVCNIGVYYMLYPYFGGDETAPHDISIQIRLTY
ncbi:MAG: hypothetical protein ABJF04_16700 [Reichenbachiella sp.]|uniref:hypothetical protein n=1 Tax=Reichenbachiella sp. TaxID=2184521 RepID=UPI003262F4C2